MLNDDHDRRFLINITHSFSNRFRGIFRLQATSLSPFRYLTQLTRQLKLQLKLSELHTILTCGTIVLTNKLIVKVSAFVNVYTRGIVEV